MADAVVYSGDFHGYTVLTDRETARPKGPEGGRNKRKDGETMKKGLIIVIAAAALVLLVAVTCTATVQTGYTGIVTTFGKVEDITLEAGFHFKTPFQKIITMDNREQKDSFTTEAFSSDIQQVNIIGSINYAINKSTAMNLFKEVGTDYFNKLVYPRMLEITKGVFSKYTAENLVANRQRLSEAIREGLHSELDQYGINVISVSIENLDFTDAFTDAVEAKQVAAQKKLQAEINADADAYALRVRSEAEGEANKKIAESLTENLIRFNEIKAWDGKLPTYMAGEGSSTMPILNLGGTEETKTESPAE